MSDPNSPRPGNPWGQSPPQQPGYPPQPPPGYPPQPPPGYPPQQPGYPPQQPGYFQPAAYAGYPPHPGYGAPARQDYAGFGSRLGAAIIDSFIWTVAIGVPVALVAIAAPKRQSICTDSFGDASTCTVPTGAGVAAIALVALAAVGLTFWFLMIRPLTKTGATIGRRAVGIKVVDRNQGTLLSTGRVVVRLLMRVVSGWACYLGYLWMLWDAEKQTWHDKASNAIVIKGR